MLIFKAVFNRFEFSFPSPSHVTILRLKSFVCPTILLIAGGRTVGFVTFHKRINNEVSLLIINNFQSLLFYLCRNVNKYDYSGPEWTWE